MYRYSPPKSNIWGHSLGKMQPARQRELFAEFLKRAVAEHSFTNGSLTFFIGDAPAFLPLEAQGQWGHVTSDDVRHFEQLLGIPARESAFYSLTAQQCEAALTELIQRSSLLPGSILLQSVDISKWLIEGQPVTTQSQVMLYYGMKPCISTFLQFETTSQFEFIKRVLADLDFCKLQRETLEAHEAGVEEKEWRRLMFTQPNKIGADNRAPRLQFHGFGFSFISLQAAPRSRDSVSDLARSA